VWGVHLWAIMAGRARYRRAAAPAYIPGTPIGVEHTVGDVLRHHPELLETFLTLGFRPLANPLLRKLVARHVSIGQACRQVGREPAEVLTALNRACAAGRHTLTSLPIVSVS
jgi:hypothetical protein